MFYYIPTPEQAAQSIQTLTYLVPFGWLVRGVHYWASQLLLVVVVVHLLRVIFTGAYAPPRRFNYLLGMLLLVACLLLDFTGYVLRWDEGIRWALVAGINLIKSIPLVGTILYGMLVGGDQPGAATLIRFYAWHIFGLSLALVAVGGWHLFRVRRDGGIAVPPPKERGDPRRITRFELVRREALAALLASIVLVLLAMTIPTPIAPPMNVGSTLAAEGRAPWFFLWVQQLLLLGNPFLWGVFVPLIILCVLTLIPYVLPQTKEAELGVWFPPSNRLARAITSAIMVLLLGLTMLALLPR